MERIPMLNKLVRRSDQNVKLKSEWRLFKTDEVDHCVSNVIVSYVQE